MNNWTIGGIHIRIHLLFWTVLGLSLAMGYFTETITLFIIVLIHEIGHMAVAKELGWRVTEIQLLPFGGVVTVEDHTMTEPLDEIVVALAGPFMNVMMLFLSIVCWQTGLWTTQWTHFFMQSNVLIAMFNLLPIWPLDGGRIIQALLTYGMPFRTSVLLSLGASCLLSSVLLGISLFDLNLNLLAIAAYLLVVNAHALFHFPYTFMKFLVKKRSHAAETANIRSVCLPPHATVLEASMQIRKGQYHLFYINGSNGGILPEEEVLNALLYDRKPHEAISNFL